MTASPTEPSRPPTADVSTADVSTEDSRVILGASVIIVDEVGRVLLARRGRAPARGLWSVPGGKVEPGETLEQAAAREAFEETGLHVHVGRKLFDLRIPADDGRVYEVHDFAATVSGGELRAGDDAAEVRWFTAEELVGLPVTDGLLGYLRLAGVG